MRLMAQIGMQFAYVVLLAGLTAGQRYGTLAGIIAIIETTLLSLAIAQYVGGLLAH